MPKRMRQAGAVLALAGILTTTAAQAANCASDAEIAAVQVAAVNQELTDAALACGPAAVTNFNRFAKAFQKELRRSDAVLMTMFKRLRGAAAGNREYDAYKTRAIANADKRRTKPGQHDNFCAKALIVFDAALAPDKPLLEDFVAAVPVYEKPVDSCAIQMAMNPTVAPTPRPTRPGEDVQFTAAPAVQ